MVGLAKFDANDYPLMSDRSVLEPGEYPAIIIKSDMKNTRAGNGQYLSLEFIIIGNGKGKGRKLWANLNLVNPSEVAVNIARSELATICKAIGLDNPGTSEAMHSKPMMISVDTEIFNEKKKNIIVGYSRAVDVDAGEVPESELPDASAPGADGIPF